MPHLKRQLATQLPEGLYAFERAVRERMPEHHLLYVLKRTQYWSLVTRHFLISNDRQLPRTGPPQLVTVSQ